MRLSIAQSSRPLAPSAVALRLLHIRRSAHPKWNVFCLIGNFKEISYQKRENSLGSTPNMDNQIVKDWNL